MAQCHRVHYWRCRCNCPPQYNYSFYVAAKFAGMHWMNFVKELGKRELSIFDEENVLRDIETAGKHAKDNS